MTAAILNFPRSRIVRIVPVMQYSDADIARAREIERARAEDEERFNRAVSVFHGSVQLPCDVEEIR